MRSRRRGTTLAECLIVITLVATVMGTVSLTLHSLYQADRRARDTVAHGRSLDSFVAQLRLDAHQAVSATIDQPSSETDPATDLQLELAGNETIQYSIHEQNIERVVRREDTVQHRETYPLPVSSPGWQLREDGTSPVVSLVLELDATGRANELLAQRKHRVDAAVSLVRRVLRISGE
jgi:hypothetical protein